MNQNNTCPLNALDNYNILAFGSAIENIPYFHVRLDQSVNPDKLHKAAAKRGRGPETLSPGLFHIVSASGSLSRILYSFPFQQ